MKRKLPTDEFEAATRVRLTADVFAAALEVLEEQDELMQKNVMVAVSIGALASLLKVKPTLAERVNEELASFGVPWRLVSVERH